MLFSTKSLLTIAGAALFSSTVHAQFGSGESQDPPNAFIFGQDGFFNPSDIWQARQRALSAHAVLASLVWILFIPTGGILLRLNIRSPWVVRVHAILQVVSYATFMVAAALGLYLVRITEDPGFVNLWGQTHVLIGLAVLGLAFLQPFLGAIHHMIFKKRAAKAKGGKSGPMPGRTMPGYIHLWLGRALIVLAVINGGFGIALARKYPFQPSNAIENVCIAYSVCAAIMFIIYVVIVIRFEVNKTKRTQAVQADSRTAMVMDEMPPTYVESLEVSQETPQEAPAKEPAVATRSG